MEWRQFDKYTYLRGEHEEYLKELAAFAKADPNRPVCHICPPCGLLNDPNGASYYRGWYHVFYQWYPFGPSHGMKHWAHVKSRDMKRWQWCDEMLIPDREYEKNGCYSGNAIEKDGLLYLFYTANYKTESGRVPKQAVAVMGPDGRIEKYEGNPVIDGAPEGMSGDIRDPFVFEKDGAYYMLLGAADRNGTGRLLLYSGPDLLHWEYRGELHVPLPSLGTMVECPGYIKVDGKDVLVLSLIGLEPEKKRFHNRFSSVYLIGRLDIEGMRFCADSWDEMDSGFDFYAPQVFYGKDGIALMMGWVGCGDQKLPDDEYMWRHGLTMARRLSVREGGLRAEPEPAEADKYGPPAPGAGKRGEPSVTRLTVSRADGIFRYQSGPEEDCWYLTVDAERGTAVLDRSGLKVAVDPEFGFTRQCSFRAGEETGIRIYRDNSFVEIYINGGERVMTARVFN